MKKKILFFTFFVLVILMITPYTLAISISKEEQNFIVKSKESINDNLIHFHFFFGLVKNFSINVSEDGLEIHCDSIIVIFIHFSNYGDQRVFSIKILTRDYGYASSNPNYEIKGIFKEHFVCGFIIFPR